MEMEEKIDWKKEQKNNKSLLVWPIKNLHLLLTLHDFSTLF